MTGENLVGSSWEVLSIGGDPTLEAGRPDMTFLDDGAVAGKASINRYRAAVTLDDDTIEFGMAITTMMAGPQELMDQEQQFLGVLTGRHFWQWDGDELIIGEGSSTLILRGATIGT